MLPLCLLGDMVMSPQVLSNGVDIWIVEEKSRGLHCMWEIERVLGNHLRLKIFFFEFDVNGFLMWVCTKHRKQLKISQRRAWNERGDVCRLCHIVVVFPLHICIN